MTADERLEKLFNERNMTMDDLPKDYGFETVMRMQETAYAWCVKNGNKKQARGQYACHLADVIDLFEILANNLIVENRELKERLGEAID